MVRSVLGGGAALGVAAVLVAATALGGDPPAPRPRPGAATPTPDVTTGWPGPLRQGASLEVVSPQRAAASERFDGPVVWADGQDATVGAVDIERLRLAREGSGPTRWRWTLEPRDFPPRAAALKPTYVVEYGLVLDTDGNGVADCQVGISNTPGEARVFRHWVRNLRTGVKDERVGPPYGFPFEFVHPEESRERSPQMTFWFLGRSRPCDPIGGAARFYAWASVSDEGRVTAWDLAPDAAWLEMSAPTIP